jgi:quinoprotein glucose dehydrogenase
LKETVLFREDHAKAMYCFLSVLLASVAAIHGASVDWPVYLGDKNSSHFSALKQITTENVNRLEIAWEYRAGDGRADNRSQIQCNPLVIDGILYGTSPTLKLLAIDAATGRELWRFDPGANTGAGVNRGVSFWKSGKERRIMYAVGRWLYAVDPGTGKALESFGTNGRVDLHEGLGRDPKKQFASATSPGVIYRDLLIQGTRVSEGPGPSSPGHIRAFDVRTGKIVWTFHTIPYPGEAGYETWPPEAYKRSGGANCWTGMALDEGRGVVFIPTGSAAFDFWGGDRIGQNLYANCLLALNAGTGKLVWYRQIVHHDIWDRDLPAPPNLVTLQRAGKALDAVVQVTKSGHIWVLNRDTGEPLFPVQEVPTPPSRLQGESAWPTQPIPFKPEPFARQLFTEDLVTDISPKAHESALERFKKANPHRLFGPPSTEGTIILPGYDGGAEWGGAGVDPRHGILFVNANEMPWILTMVETKAKAGGQTSSGQQLYTQVCAACHGVNRQGDPARAFPNLASIGQKLKKPEIVKMLETGRGVMPSFAFLNQEQREALADHLLGDDRVQPQSAQREAASDAIFDSPYSHTGYNRFLDPEGYPAIKPPWGTLNAVDLNTGEYLWRVPLGELPELTARGIAPTGSENYGGPVVTAGGLVFIAASKDEMLRAFDQRSGKILWQTKLPAGGYATPATYSIKGRQYLVIACGGGKMGTKSGDAYVAFALPRK